MLKLYVHLEGQDYNSEHPLFASLIGIPPCALCRLRRVLACHRPRPCWRAFPLGHLIPSDCSTCGPVQGPVQFCPMATPSACSCIAKLRQYVQGRCGGCPPGSGVMLNLFSFSENICASAVLLAAFPSDRTPVVAATACLVPFPLDPAAALGRSPPPGA